MRKFGRGDKENGRNDRSPESTDREREERKRIRTEKEAAPAHRRAGVAKAVGGFGKALKQGAGETRSRSAGVPTEVGERILEMAGSVFAIFFDVLGFVVNLLIALIRRVAVPVRWALIRLRHGVAAASRLLTPARALTVVVAGAAILLALSQFADYRGVSIGTDAYAEVDTVVAAPDRVRDETGTAHGYAMVPLAIACLALLVVTVRGRRWQLSRLIAGVGVAAILLALIVDRSAGLDTGELTTQYQGVEARLLGGFYAQIFSGLVLAVSALLLGRELRLADATAPARPERTRSKARKGILRRAPKPEGARA